jgi:hypothetical protein
MVLASGQYPRFRTQKRFAGVPTLVVHDLVAHYLIEVQPYDPIGVVPCGRCRACCRHDPIPLMPERGSAFSLTDGNLTEHPFKKVPRQFQERYQILFVFSGVYDWRVEHEETFLRSRRVSNLRCCGPYSRKRSGI